MNRTVSAGGIVVNGSGEILVVNQNGVSWSLPKGHIEDGEDALTAARREIYEESGVERLNFVRELGSYERYRIGEDGGEDQTEMKTIHMFLFTTEQTELAPLDPENPEALWVDKNDVIKILTHPKDREFFTRVYLMNS